MIWVLGSDETGRVDEESMANVCETVRTYVDAGHGRDVEGKTEMKMVGSSM